MDFGEPAGIKAEVLDGSAPAGLGDEGHEPPCGRNRVRRADKRVNAEGVIGSGSVPDDAGSGFGIELLNVPRPAGAVPDRWLMGSKGLPDGLPYGPDHGEKGKNEENEYAKGRKALVKNIPHKAQNPETEKVQTSAWRVQSAIDSELDCIRSMAN